MAGQEYQYIQDALKDYYGKAIVNQVPKKSPLWAMFEKKTAPFAGKRMVIPVQLSFVESVGARAANNYALPEASRITYDQAYVTVKRIYGRVAIDGFSVESSKGQGGWVDLFTNEVKGTVNAFAIDIDRQLLCGGKGILGVADAVADQVITVKGPGGLAGDTPVTKFFRKGMVLDIYKSDGTKHADSVTITAVNDADGKITVSGTISSVAQDDLIYKEDAYSATAANLGEMMGIEGVVGSGNTPGDSDFQGIDASSESLWQAYIDSGSAALSESKIQNLLDAIESRSDGDPVNLAVTGYTLRNKLISLMQALRHIDTLDLKAGWKAIKYVGGSIELPFLVHPKAPTGHVYFLSTNHIKLYQLLPLTWDEKAGGMVKNVAGYDVYEAWFKFYGNLGTDCRNAHGKMTAATA